MGRLGARPRDASRDRHPASRRRRRLDHDRLRPCGEPRPTRRTLAGAWFEPDPVALAVPLADLDYVFATLRRAGRRVAVATTDDRRPTEATIEALGVAGFVDDLLCGDDDGPTKPEPAALAGIAARLGVPIERTAMVGDTPADLRMAGEARARAIGVRSGIAPIADLAPFADIVLCTITELVAVSGED